MNNNKSIYKAFNAFKKSNDTSTPDNEYKPLERKRIASTVIPTNRTTFNETMKHIHNQLRIEL